MKKIIVTTSWDDGDRLNLKLAGLLEKYRLKGTFYVAPQGKRFSLAENELKQLAEFQEIGAHSVSHPHLTRLDNLEAEKEIKGSKEYLENLLGKEIKMFCYPYGEFNGQIKKIVKEAGFWGARTVKDLCFEPPVDFFEFGTTLHIYPFSFWQTIRFFQWPRLARGLFNRVLKNSGIYHLWGHSWEIEKHGLWPGLEEVFAYISHRQGVAYLTNGQTLETL